MYNFSSYKIGLTRVTAYFPIVTQTYSMRYQSGTTTVTAGYKVRYQSTYTIPMKLAYVLRYTSTYVDTAFIYRIKYTSGKDPQDSFQAYTIKYTNPIFENNTNYYSIIFNLTSPKLVASKLVYRVNYDSSPVSIINTLYKLKYTSDTTYINTNNYTVRYSTTSIPPVQIVPVLVRGVDSPVDIVFGVYSIEELNLVDTLFVAANLPVYQLVEYTTDQSLPYIKYYPKDDLYGLALESSVRAIIEPLYQCQGYIVLKGIEELNSVSLDVYSISQDYKQLNDARSFFFNLSTLSFVPITATIDGTDYTVKNMDMDYFSKDYLNFVTNTITPIFVLADSCCFSQKIEQTSLGGTVCSPF